MCGQDCGDSRAYKSERGKKKTKIIHIYDINNTYIYIYI